MRELTFRPRVIRKVIKVDAKGRPKIARDRKTFIQMERVVARVSRGCAAGKECKFNNPLTEGVIYAGDTYAKITDGAIRRRGGGYKWPESRDYHFACVPPEARPLVRFLVPKS